MQLPVAVAATLTHFEYARLDVSSAALLAAALVCGLFVSGAVQDRVSGPWLVRLTNLAVILTTLAMLAAAYLGKS